MPDVVILAPMPLELDAITTAFGMTDNRARIGNCDVTAVHIGMGPPLTRAALERLLAAGTPVDHVMIAGICGGLDPDLPVGTLINPLAVIDHTSGAEYPHTPPGDAPRAGKLITTEGVSLDHQLSQQFFARGCVGVDMETSAVAEVCGAHGCPWSVYRCIGDRYVDGLLDERVVALANPDGSGNMDELSRLLKAEPQLARNLERLGRDAGRAAKLAAEAAVRGCAALA